MRLAPTASHLLTAEELERVEIPGKVTELVRGRLVVREPPGTRHGSVAAKVAIVAPDGHLDGEVVLPGFRCELADLLR